jgi:hypothetical protein
MMKEEEISHGGGRNLYTHFHNGDLPISLRGLSLVTAYSACLSLRCLVVYTGSGDGFWGMQLYVMIVSYGEGPPHQFVMEGVEGSCT